ncbi:hypothetical protein FACS1894211_10370 [Clostridia bacterium]|nr:hypothetical protein FACS1894211_10370 [Clostridia bacterium]
MDVWYEFITLFSEMNLADALFFGAGLIFLSIEIVRREKVFGFLGGAALVAGVIARLSHGGSAAAFFFMTFLICAVLLGVYLVDTAIRRYGFLLKVPALELGEEKDEGKDYYFLLGLEGVAMGDLEPAGKVTINNISINAVSKSGVLERGALIRVVEVEGPNVVVEKIDEF